MLGMCQKTSFACPEKDFILRPPSHFTESSEQFIKKERFESYLRSDIPEEFNIAEILKTFGLREEDAVEVLIRLKYDIGEYLEVVDEKGNSTGRLKQRKLIHRDGDWHRTVHIIIVNKKGEMLRTVRGPKAHTSKGAFDISAAGHVAIGDWEDTAYEEIREELAINRNEISNLIIIGEESDFAKVGESNEELYFDEAGTFHYPTNVFNRELSTLCIAVIDLDTEEINKRLQDQGELRPVEKIDFILMAEIEDLVRQSLDKYSSTFKQYFLREENLRHILDISHYI